MADIAFLTLYDKSSMKPCCACVRIKDKYKVYDLYRQGIRKPIIEVKKSINDIKQLILKASDSGRSIVTTNFKQSLETYELPTEEVEYTAYDLHLDVNKPFYSTDDAAKDTQFLINLTSKMVETKPQSYQSLLAKASVVYYDLQQRGLIINDTLVYPKWSLETFSGRSKSLGFNIQGHSDNDKITTIVNSNHSVLIHFDWISADLRVASLLSNDLKLQSSFIESDPYTVLQEALKSDEDSLSREECKLFLLKSINSMNMSHDALVSTYPKLCKWINSVRTSTEGSDGNVKSLLGRKFRVANAKNALAVLNGAMQGSVAHAMHSVMWQVWQKCRGYLLTDIHDSLVLSVPNDSQIIKTTIDTILPIFMFPFREILDSNPCFPAKVSIGKKWKDWKLYKVYRDL